MQQFIINLWFDSNAEEAANFYTNVFPNSSIDTVTLYPDAGQAVTGKTAGSVMTVAFTVNGQPFIALNGGDVGFKFNEAFSLVVNCVDQAEIDYYWNALGSAAGGTDSQCGWLKDKFGFSWQIVIHRLDELLGNSDPKTAARVMTAMLKMTKIDIAELEAAAEA